MIYTIIIHEMGYSTKIYPVERYEQQSGKIKKYRKVLLKTGNNILKWSLVPVEIIFGYTHLLSCFGCFGSFGNPITPIIEDIEYDKVYKHKSDKALSGITSSFFGIVRLSCCLVSCAGCVGVVSGPPVMYE